MAENLNLGSVVKGYQGIQDLEKEAMRRRMNVVRVMRQKMQGFPATQPKGKGRQ